MEAYPIIKLGRLSAVVSFAVGTLIFLTFILSRDEMWEFVGFYFLLGAVLINTAILILLLWNLIFIRDQRINVLKAIGFLLLNIPVVIIYLEIVGHFEKNI